MGRKPQCPINLVQRFGCFVGLIRRAEGTACRLKSPRVILKQRLQTNLLLFDK